MASRVPTRAMIDVEEPVITPQLGLDLDDLDDFDDLDNHHDHHDYHHNHDYHHDRIWTWD